MSEQDNGTENDLDSVVTDVAAEGIDEDNPQTLAYQIASHIMEQFRPGFVIIGSPIMGETANGHPYPDAVGLIINSTPSVGLTKTSTAEILVELARQLMQEINDVEDYLREETE